MRKITSPSAFKTCYIAQVKEELGYSVRRAHNRRTRERKHRVPSYLRTFIEKAILDLERSSEKPTYRRIQEKAFELYREQLEKEPAVRKFRGIFKDTPEEVIRIAENKDLAYEG